MKKSLLTMACCISLSTLHAQEPTSHGYRFCDNWSASLYAGGVTPSTHGDFIKDMRATMGFSVNKQVSTFYGIGLEEMWSINTYHSSTAFDASNLMLVSRYNLNYLLRRFRGSASLFSMEFASGLGWLHVNDAYLQSDGDKTDGNWLSSKMGLHFNFHLGKSKAWTIAIRPAMVWNLTLKDKENLRFHSEKTAWEFTAGLTYHFRTPH